MFRKDKSNIEFHLDEAHLEFEKAFFENEEVVDLDADRIAEVYGEAFEAAATEMVQIIAEDLISRKAGMLKEHRKLRAGFTKRNRKRWKDSFDLIETLIVIAGESGEAVSKGLYKGADDSNSAKVFAVTTLHARTIRISREMLCLMTAGFPDAALARWRSLHEHATVSLLLSQSDNEISERFLAARNCKSYKAALQLLEYGSRANIEPHNREELDILKTSNEATISAFGTEIKNEWGWAKPLIDKKNITFFDLEQHCNLDHWRPRVKWASQEIHAGFVPPEAGLGVSEAKEKSQLIGESNSGMVDPGQMLAISLTISTNSLLLIEPNLDRIATSKCLETFCDSITDALLRESKKTAADL